MTDAQCLAAGLDLRRAWRGGELLPPRCTTEHPLGRFAELYAIPQGDLYTKADRRKHVPYGGLLCDEEIKRRRKREPHSRVTAGTATRDKLRRRVRSAHYNALRRAGLTTEAA